MNPKFQMKSLAYNAFPEGAECIKETGCKNNSICMYPTPYTCAMETMGECRYTPCMYPTPFPCFPMSEMACRIPTPCMYPTPAPPCFQATILACLTHSVVYGHIKQIPDIETLGRELENALKQIADSEKQLKEKAAKAGLRPLSEE